MEDFYRLSLIGRGGPVISTTVSGTDFALKNHMVQLLRQNCQFHGLKDEDANEHLDKYLSITQFIKQNKVSQDIINLNLFRFSLTHEAKSWFYTLKTHSIHTWEEMVSKILLLNQILTFYNGITMIDQERFMVAAGVFYNTATDMSTHYSETTSALRERVEVLGKQTGYTIQSVQHNPGPCYPNTFYYLNSDESDDDERAEMIEDQKSIHHLSGSPTPSSYHVVASLSPSLTPIGDSDSILGETDTLLPHHDSTSPKVDDDIFDLEGDILFLEGLSNDEISSDLPPLELNNDPDGDILFLENLLKGEPLEAKNSKIDSLIKGPSDTLLMGDEDIKFNPPMDVDNLVPIPRVSEKPLDSLDYNPIYGIHNKESDKSKMETIMDEVQNHSP
nr:reverse transcriptase domain-containing protein [Tanacetum cinerariifolium]